MAGFSDVLEFAEGKVATHAIVYRHSISDPASTAATVIHFLDGSTLTVYSDQYDYYEAKK